jgi:hypothetical protein
MKATLLATITLDDGIWTVSLHQTSDGGTVLRFVRDWIDGGRERVVVPVKEMDAQALIGCARGELAQRLEAVLRGAPAEPGPGRRAEPSSLPTRLYAARPNAAGDDCCHRPASAGLRSGSRDGPVTRRVAARIM